MRLHVCFHISERAVKKRIAVAKKRVRTMFQKKRFPINNTNKNIFLFSGSLFLQKNRF